MGFFRYFLIPAFMTKYQTNKLSPVEVRHAKPTDKLYRLRDGGGLSCDILTSGKKIWRYSYRFNGKQKTFTIGEYPPNKNYSHDESVYIGLSEANFPTRV